MSKTKRGGARPGAGRPLQGTGRKKAAAIMLTPEGWAAREHLRDAGLDVSDFGTLDLVRHLPIDLINIAPSLTGGMEDNPTTKYMVETITGFTHRLNIRTCFSGIEDEETEKMASAYPISDVMGYYFGRPCRIQEFMEKYLK